MKKGPSIRKGLLIALAVAALGAVVVPKLYWDNHRVVMTCANLEHAIEVLNDTMTRAVETVEAGCLPGQPECIAEGWMFNEAKSLRDFILEIHKASCQDT